MDTKVNIDAFAIERIRDFALKTFHAKTNLPSNAAELQVFLILKGFELYLQSLQLEPNFTVQSPKGGSDDTGPLDDFK
jgi:hypothetical protein